MRYDLEFNIVSQLSSSGLSELSEIFYGTDGKMLTPSQWDTQTLIGKAESAGSSISTDTFKKMQDVPSWLYASGVSSLDEVALSDIIARNNMVCPTFRAGSIFFNKYEFKWSKATIRKKVEFDDALGYYKCEVDSTIDKENVKAFTLRFKYPGYVSYEKSWEYVEFISDDSMTLAQNLKNTFMSNPDKEFKLTVVSDDTGTFVYLSGNKIGADMLRLGVAYANKGSVMALGEYPADVETVAINGYDISQGEYRLFTSTMVFDNITNSDIDIDITYDVTPILTYSQLDRVDRDEVVYSHANILPSVVGFNNGVIALHNVGSAGGTIQTDENVNIIIPVSIELSVDNTEASVLDSVKCTAKLVGIDEMPVKDAKIRFDLSSSSDDAIFVESGSATYTTHTSIDGNAYANAFIDRTRFGWYLQKEWVSSNKITVPFDIQTDNENEIYLYFITSDDPILGKLYASRFETELTEFYGTETSLESYEVAGRKIAYVKMLNRVSGGDNIVYSSFVKPKNILRNQRVTSDFRNLYIKNSDQDIASFLDRLPDSMSLQLDTPITSFDALAKGYADGVLPDNKLDIYRAVSTEGSVIEFENTIPRYDNIVGYWLITGSSSDIKVKATFDDSNSFMHLESNEISISTGNYIKSEYEFILSDSASSNQNTALSAFGYYTVSEYLNNPYNQNACTYTCRYSDPVTKSCLFKDNTFAQYYSPDKGIGACTKPAEHNTLEKAEQCPITTMKYLEDANGDPLFEQEEVVADTFIDKYSWANQASYITYSGKEPHIALYDGDITQEDFDTMVASEGILPKYQDNPNYEESAWGFINPFIMLAEKPA